MAQCLVLQNNTNFIICDCFAGDAWILSDNDDTCKEKKKEKIVHMDKEKLLAKFATSITTHLKPIYFNSSPMKHRATPVNKPQACLAEATTVTVAEVENRAVAVAVAVAITHNT
jgi:hypothetical protein